MIVKKYYLYLILTALLLTGCSQGTSPTPSESIENPSEETEESLPPPTNAPFPEETDPNAYTFDDNYCGFVSIIKDEEVAADGTLSVESVDGNPMLKFTDTSTDEKKLGKAVQKLKISVGQLLSPNQLECVESISFDLYVKAKGDFFQNKDGENLQVPGWIGGGGGTTCADGKWYSFSDFEATNLNEFDLERSDACHVEFKFLLADSGKKWDSSMENVNFSVMRWGIQNLSDLYLDNLTFYDQEGNSIPLNVTKTPDTTAETEETT